MEAHFLARLPALSFAGTFVQAEKTLDRGLGLQNLLIGMVNIFGKNIQ